MPERSFYNRISVRLLVIVFFLLVVPTGVAVMLLGQSLTNKFEEKSTDDLMASIEVKADRAKSILLLLTGGVKSKATHIENHINSEFTEWKILFKDGKALPPFYKSKLNRELLGELAQTLEESEQYIQMRIVLPNGDELVRIDRNENRLVTSSKNQLQNKAHRPYFQNALNAKPDEVYIHPATLQMEHGKIVKPLLPTIRVARKISFDDGKLFGVLILNLHTNMIFSFLERKREDSFLIIDQTGQYLYHWKSRFLYATELKNRYNLLEEEPELKKSLQKQESQKHYDRELDEYRIWKKVYYQKNDKSRYWVFMLRKDITSMTAPWISTTQNGLITITILLIVGFLIFAYTINQTLSPLNRLSKGLEEVGAGRFETRLQAEPETEIGIIVDAFNMMVKKLESTNHELRKLAKLEKVIASISPNGFVIINEEGTIVSVNKAAERMFGFKANEMIGENVTILMPSPHRENYHTYIANYLKGGKPKILGNVVVVDPVRKNGDSFRATLYVDEAKVDDERVFAAIVEDVTEIKKVEEQLELTQFSIDHSSEAVYWINKDGKFIYANYKACWSLGYLEEELLKMSIFDISAGLTRDSWTKHWDELQTMRTLNFETKQIRNDGSIFPCDITTTLIELGSSIFECAFVRDITNQKSIMEKLQKANEEVKTFANIVSHDLRSPLVSLQGFGHELKMACAELDEILSGLLPRLKPKTQKRAEELLREDIPEALNFIKLSTSKMEKLVSSILSLARYGTRKLQIKEININTLIEEKLLTLKHQIEEKGITVKSYDLPVIRADELSMEQIFGNLLANAINYLDPKRAGIIEIGAREERDAIIFHIKDNGRGIAERDFHKVFELFRRAGQLDVEGEGMGLPYVQTLVRRHDGKIWFESEEGVGTTFSFKIAKELTAIGDDEDES